MIKKLILNKINYILDLSQTAIYMKPKEDVQAYSVTINDNGEFEAYPYQVFRNNDPGLKEQRRIVLEFEYNGDRYYISNLWGTRFCAYKASDVEIENGGVINSLLSHVYQPFTRIFRKELIA